MFARSRMLLIFGICASAASGADLVVDMRAAEVKTRAEQVAFVPVVEKGPTLDGKIDEPVWRDAALIKDWIDLTSGKAGDVKAQLRLVATKEALYAALTLRGVKGLVVQEPPAAGTAVPKGGFGGSALEIFIDCFGDSRTNRRFVTNPRGARHSNDILHGSGGDSDTWKSVGATTADMWTMEVQIPSADLRGQNPGVRPAWGANFYIRLVDASGVERIYTWTGGRDNAAWDYGSLIFGTKQNHRSSNPGATLTMDRVVYDVRDTSAVAILRRETTGSIPGSEKLELAATLMQGETLIATQHLGKLPSPAVDMTIDLQPLAEGDYTFKVSVMDGEKVVGTAERAFSKKQRKVHPEPVTSGKIPVRVHAQKDLSGVVWPITTGVPFSLGSLQSADNVRLLDPAGKEVALQTSVRSTWNRRGPVQWLGLDFIPTLAAGEQVYTLEYGPGVPGVKSAKPASGLTVTQTDDLITVNTGPLQFTVNRKQFALISSATIGGKLVLAPNVNGGLSLVDHEGNRYTSASDSAAAVTVEEQGPVRVTICAKGWYVKEGSVPGSERTSVELPTDRLCLFTVRLSAFAGSPLVKVAVSTTMTQDTDKVRLRELTIGLPIQSSDIKVGDVKLADQGYLIQDRWDRTVDSAGKEHPRSEGWIETPDLRIAVRRFWQLFPKEIGYSKGVLTIHPWPAHGHDVFPMEEQLKLGNIYKLWYAHQGKELAFKFPAEYMKSLDEAHAANKGLSSGYYKDMAVANAQGLNIHNDLLLSFGSSINGATAAKLVNDNPHALPDSTYLCATNVFGPILHADPQFAELEQTYKRGFQHLTTRSEPNNEYGMFIFGNMHTIWNYGSSGLPGAGNIHRVWLNGHYLIANMPYVQYARTGDPVWMGWGRDHSNILRDVGMVHFVSNQRRWEFHLLGAVYHCKGFAPWAGDSAIAYHPLCISHLAYDYYLFGNRRSLDAMNDWVAGINALWPNAYPTREGMTTLAETIEAYKLTWNPGLVEVMDRFRKAITAQPSGDPKYPSWDYHPLLCERDYLFSGDPKLYEAFRGLVAASAGGSIAGGVNGGGTMHYDGLFALLDNNANAIKRWPQRLYRDATAVVDRPGEFGDGLVDNMWMRYVYPAHKYPYALKAIKQFNLAIERPQRTTPAPLLAVGRTAILAVKEEMDQEFAVTIVTRRVRPNEMPVRVIRADGKEVASATVPKVEKAEDLKPFTFNVPTDGQAGEYLIVIGQIDSDAGTVWPVTTLKHEVAVVPPGKEGEFNVHLEGMRLFLAAPASDMKLKLGTDAKNAMAMQLLDAKDQIIGRASASRYVGPNQDLVVPAKTPGGGPLSMYFSNTANMRCHDANTVMIFALDPAALFTPSLAALPK